MAHLPGPHSPDHVRNNCVGDHRSTHKAAALPVPQVKQPANAAGSRAGSLRSAELRPLLGQPTTLQACSSTIRARQPNGIMRKQRTNPCLNEIFQTLRECSHIASHPFSSAAGSNAISTPRTYGAAREDDTGTAFQFLNTDTQMEPPSSQSRRTPAGYVVPPELRPSPLASPTTVMSPTLTDADAAG